MAEPGDRVTVPPLLSDRRTMWLATAAALVGGLGVAAWGLVAQTGANRVMAVVVGLLVLLGTALALWRSTWLDTRRGTISHRSAGRTRTVPWAEAATVDLERNRGGQLHLLVRGEGGTVRVAVVAVDLGGDRSLAAEHLRLLAEEIDRWAPDRGPVVAALRAQADHVGQGRGVRESPLAQRL